jgi:hypothetical protein
MINRERKNIYRSLRRHHDEGTIQVEQEASSSLEDIFDVFRNYDNQVAIFHYGGHASGTHLHLEGSDTSTQKGYADGLAQLLGQQESLQLVFLNGCATKPQVELLLKNGVKAVIATSVPIQDNMAVEFAEQFYNALAGHSTIQRSFQIATAFVSSKYQGFSVQSYRGFDLREEQSETRELPWGLYLRDGAESVLSWTLPERTSKSQVLKTRFDYETRVDVNDILIDIICEDLAALNKDLDDELSKEELDIPSIKREIVDSFPTPIGEQLRKLFTRSNNPGVPDDMELFTLARLEQLAMTYRTTVQFLSYAAMSQLWDERFKNQEFTISEDYIVDFNSFFAINAENARSFDFVKLVRTITDIFDDNKIPYFIDELNNVKIDIKKSPELYQAYVFMNNLNEALHDDRIEKDKVEALCMEAEQNLGIVLKECAFLVKYKLATIKNIEIIKKRHEKARFRHSQIMLNRALTVASTGIAEIGVEFDNFTDNKCVLFLKTKDNEVQDYLNLTPFIIDENALNNDYSSKLYLFNHQDGDNYYYKFLNNANDPPLVINEDNQPEIQVQFERFKAEIFGKAFQPKEKAADAPSAKGSRFMKKR